MGTNGDDFDLNHDFMTAGRQFLGSYRLRRPHATVPFLHRGLLNLGIELVENDLKEKAAAAIAAATAAAAKAKADAEAAQRAAEAAEDEYDEYLPLQWNEKGPLVDSDLIEAVIGELFKKLGDRLSSFDREFLQGKLNDTDQYSQVWFTKASGAMFENLCRKARVKCPFHINRLTRNGEPSEGDQLGA